MKDGAAQKHLFNLVDVRKRQFGPDTVRFRPAHVGSPGAQAACV
jgi:hypothetical protein